MKRVQRIAHWEATAIAAGEAVADAIVGKGVRITDDQANILIERAGLRLAHAMLAERVPEDVIKATLDRMVEAFDARLGRLEAALQGTGGHA